MGFVCGVSNSRRAAWQVLVLDSVMVTRVTKNRNLVVLEAILVAVMEKMRDLGVVVGLRLLVEYL